MKKIFPGIIVSVILITLIVAYLSNNEIRNLTKTLGVDFSSGTISYHNDSHGGFHGDGTKLEKISMPKDNTSITEKIEENDQWQELPLPEDINILVYGKTTDTGVIGPYFHSSEPFFPNIKNGYYFFKDRQNEDTDILSRHSVNFTVAIFDVETNTLYYCEQDS